MQSFKLSRWQEGASILKNALTQSTTLLKIQPLVTIHKKRGTINAKLVPLSNLPTIQDESYMTSVIHKKQYIMGIHY